MFQKGTNSCCYSHNAACLVSARVDFVECWRRAWRSLWGASPRFPCVSRAEPQAVRNAERGRGCSGEAPRPVAGTSQYGAPWDRAAAAARLRGAHSPAPSGRRRAGFLVLSPHSDRVPHAAESAPTPGGLINGGRRRHPALAALLTPARSAWGAWYRVRPPLPLFLRPSAFSRRCCLFPGACLLVARPGGAASALSFQPAVRFQA